MEHPCPAGAPEPGGRNVIRFEEGIYGFEDIREFVLLPCDGRQAVWSLRAADAPYPSLIVVDPFLIVPDYDPSPSPEDLRRLGAPGKEGLCYLAVAVIKRPLSDSVVNLKSPVVVNVRTRTGRQVILEDDRYPVRYRLFRGTEAGEGAPC